MITGDGWPLENRRELETEVTTLRVEVRWLREENDRLVALSEKLRDIVIESGMEKNRL